MFVIFGRRSAGRIFTSDGQLVSTLFIHLFFVPVYPVASIRVVQKHFLLDIGPLAPLSKKSVLAGYLRNILFVFVCLGFSAMFNALFLNQVVPNDQPIFLLIGTTAFVASSLLWLSACFFLGAKPSQTRVVDSGLGRFSAGLAALIAILVGMFGPAHYGPRPPTVENIAANRAISDEQALRDMAALSFSRATRIATTPEEDGIHVRIDCRAVTDPAARKFNIQISDADKIDKAAALVGMQIGACDLVQFGSPRRLSRLTISVSTTAQDQDPHFRVVEAYRINVPREKFAQLMELSRQTGNDRGLSRETVFAMDRIFVELGVVELDNFASLGSRQAGGR